jgi:hypothetical protein
MRFVPLTPSPALKQKGIAKYMEGSGRGLIYYISIFLEELKKTVKNVSQDSRFRADV